MAAQEGETRLAGGLLDRFGRIVSRGVAPGLGWQPSETLGGTAPVLDDKTERSPAFVETAVLELGELITAGDRVL